MKKLTKIMTFAYLACCIAVAVIMFIIASDNDAVIINSRSEKTQAVVADLTKWDEDVPSAPVGIRQIYEFTIGGRVMDSDLLSIYLVHTNGVIYINNEKVGEFMANRSAKLGKSGGCSYLNVPLKREDANAKVRIELYPIYKSSIDRDIELTIAPATEMMEKEYNMEFWQILLSLTCIGVGFVFFLISMMNYIQSHQAVYLVYLSIFSIMLGIWRIMDVRVLPVMLGWDSKTTSYLGLSMLYLVVPVFLLFAKMQIKEGKKSLLDYAFVVSTAGSVISIVLQLTGIKDYRETLNINHGVLGFSMVIMVITILTDMFSKRRSRQIKLVFSGFVFCVIGAGADVVIYRLFGASTDLPYTLLAFIIFILITGVVTVYDINHRSTTDVNTGLFSHGRCRELLSDPQLLSEKDGVAVIVFGINYLQRINENYGHDSGDRVIASFANLINSKIPAGSFLGRYDSDEFMAVLYDVTPREISQAEDSIKRAVREYNMGGKNRVAISYCTGSSTSIEKPGRTIKEMFDVADEKMNLARTAHYMLNDETAYLNDGRSEQ